MDLSKKGALKYVGRLGKLGAILAAAVILAAGAGSPGAAEDALEPLGSAWKDYIVPKHRAIISFLDSDWGVKTFRGQGADLETDLSDRYGVETGVTTPGNVETSGSSSSRVFSMAQSGGTMPGTLTLDEEFMGSRTFEQVPSGIICSSYLTMADSEGSRTALWMELSEKSAATGSVRRIGRVKIDGISRPYYKYKFNADLIHTYAPPLDMNRAHEMVSWDWNGDGWTDWLVSYITNPSKKDDHKNMKVGFLFVDGHSLYKACTGTGTARFWENTSVEYTTGGDVIGGLTTRKPPNSVRTAIGDMDGDGVPEVVLYYTKVQGTSGITHNNHLKILNIHYNGSSDPSWEWVYEKGSDVGRWHVQYDSAAVTMGDINGDGKDELAVLHGNADISNKPSPLYLDVYKNINGSIKKLVTGERVGTTSRMAAHSTPSVEAAIADLDGDGTGELVWTGTDSDHGDRLWIVVHKWAGSTGAVNISGPGTKYSYRLNDAVSGWTLDSGFNRYSLAAGRFIYPETENLTKEIAIASTTPGGSGKLGLRWGVFRWNAASGLTAAGIGHKPYGMRECNVVPLVAAADLDRDSMILGKPEGFTVYDNIEPVFIIQSPPRHWDQITGNGESRTLDAFSLLDGYSTTMNGKASDSQAVSTTRTTSGHWGASAAFTMSKKNFFKDNAKIFDAGVKYAGEAAAKNTSSKTTTITSSLRAVAQYDDQVYFRANTHDVWRYPVLAPVSQAFVTDNGGSYRRFIQFVVPRKIESTFASTAGKEVDWYQPLHNSLNLFSYPRRLEQTRDFPLGKETKADTDFWKDINGAVLARSTGQIMGNVDSTEASFTMEVREHQEHLSSLKNTFAAYGNLNMPSWGLMTSKTLSWNLNGDFTWGTDSATTSDKSRLGGVTVSWPGCAKYASPSGMTPSEQQFTVDAAIYTSDGGTLSFAYAVSRLAKTYSRIWGTGSPYTETPDPALNLPRQWVISSGKWVRNPFEGDARRIRGILFEGASAASPGGTTGQVMPVNTDVSAVLRIYNYSFVPTGRVTVSLAFQPLTSVHEEPDISRARVLVSRNIDFIPGRDQGISSDNWQDMRISMRTPGEQALGYLHISLATDGGNLHADNDRGHILVGIYDPEKIPAVRASGPRAMGVSKGKSLFIEPGSLSVYPITAGGEIGEDTYTLDPGETAVVTGKIRYDAPEGDEESGLLHVSVYLRDHTGIVSHRIVPLLEKGGERIIRMFYRAPESGGPIPLRMIVTSDLFPAANDSDPDGRSAARTLNDNGGSGCSSAGFSPAAVLILLPLVLLRKH